MIKCVLNFVGVILACLSVNAGNPEAKTTIKFKENKGQVSDQYYRPRQDVLFYGNINGTSFHIKKSGISYQLYKIDDSDKTKGNIATPKRHITEKQNGLTMVYRLDFNWLNCNTDFETKGEGVIPEYDNYYLPTCPQGVLMAKSYQEVTLKKIYKNIDLRYYNNNNELKYDYVVGPYGDYKQIQIEVKGADSIVLLKDGSLEIHTPLGIIKEGKPKVFQKGKELVAYWSIIKNILQFEIENCDISEEMVIDPAVRVWGTYYGGSLSEHGYDIQNDKAGNLYHVGRAEGYANSTIATVGSHQFVFGGNFSDCYLVKFRANGTRAWGTYYGGEKDDYTWSCSLDQNANIYMCGSTSSTVANTIASVGSYQSNYGVLGGGGSNAFLVKFDSSGVRQWGTYYGYNDETAVDCATDKSGNVYVLGSTTATNSSIISTPGSHQPNKNSVVDMFLVKFNGNGNRIWSTFYGGENTEYPQSCATDKENNVYITGYGTSAVAIATTNGYQSAFGGGSSDMILTKFDSTGVRKWGTYYGNSGNEYSYDCTVDNSGNIYMAGYVAGGFPSALTTSGCHQSVYGGGIGDVVLVKFSTNGNRIWGTLYGGTGNEFLYGCITDYADNVYIGGVTTLTQTATQIATAGVHQVTLGGGIDAFFAKFDKNGARQWGSYYGGSNTDRVEGISSDNSGNIYITGWTGTNQVSNEIATAGSHQNTYGGGSPSPDSFIAKFFECAPPVIKSSLVNDTICYGESITLNAYGFSNYLWSTGSASASIIVTPSTSIVYSLTGTTGTCVSTSTINIVVRNPPSLTVSASGTICSGSNNCLSVNGATTYTWTGPCGFSSNLQSPCLTFFTSCGCNYSVSGTDLYGCKSAATICVNVVANPIITANTSNTLICAGQTATLVSNGANTYSWSTSATSSTIVVSPTITTNYTVTGTDLNGCSNNTAITQSVSACTGIGELTSNTEIIISPNPVKGQITISSTSPIETIKIFSVEGKLILQRNNSDNSRTQTLNISELSTGVYFVNCLIDGKENYIKVIKE